MTHVSETGEISSDLYRHQKTPRNLFLKAVMIKTIVFERCWVYISKVNLGQACFNSTQKLWDVFLFAVTP